MPLNRKPNALGGPDLIMRQTLPGMRANFNLPQTVPHPLQVLREMVDKAKTQKAVAEQLHISQQYLCEVLSGRRDVSASLADKLGYQRMITFMRKP